jgi:hypothetical protein
LEAAKQKKRARESIHSFIQNPSWKHQRADQLLAKPKSNDKGSQVEDRSAPISPKMGIEVFM